MGSKKSRISRHWVNFFVPATATIVSLASLWVSVEAEEANRQMVAAASLPLMKANNSNANEMREPVITLALTNAGVCPAKIETFELFWNKKPYASVRSLLTACCSYNGAQKNYPMPLTTTSVTDSIVRAG